MQLNDDNNALADFNAVIRYDPRSIATLLNRGALLLRHGDFKSALADYNEAIRLDPNYANSYFNRGLAWQRKATSKKPPPIFKKRWSCSRITPKRIRCASTLLSTADAASQ